MPYWGCGASVFLGPTGLIVFAMGTPVSCRACGLPQSTIVMKPFPPSGGFGSWPSCGVPYLRLALCSLACVSPGGCPSFSQVGPAPSHWVPLLWTWFVWEASTVSFSYVFLRDVVTLWVNSVFLSLLIANEGLHWWLFLFRYSQPILGVESSHSYVLLQLVGTSCGWWPRFYLACHCTLPVDCLLLASSAAWVC